jgi:hypothetical protein
MFSAATIGARVGGAPGMQAAIFHTMLDQVSTQVEQQFGAERRDILFAALKIGMK